MHDTRRVSFERAAVGRVYDISVASYLRVHLFRVHLQQACTSISIIVDDGPQFWRASLRRKPPYNLGLIDPERTQPLLTVNALGDGMLHAFWHA